MNRNKVSIGPRIVNGTNVNPSDTYSFMGALRVLEPLDEFHSNGFHNWRFHQNHLPSYPQNHHPLSHAMNRNKVSIEPRIVNGINVNPPDKYSFMGALRILEPLDEFHSTSYIYIYMLYCYTIHILND